MLGIICILSIFLAKNWKNISNKITKNCSMKVTCYIYQAFSCKELRQHISSQKLNSFTFMERQNHQNSCMKFTCHVYQAFSCKDEQNVRLVIHMKTNNYCIPAVARQT